MQATTDATGPRHSGTRSGAAKTAPPPRPPMTPDQRTALDLLHHGATPGFELALGPPGTEVLLSARVKRAKRYGYGAPTAVLFLDALPALDGLTRTEFRVLLRVLALAPFGDNVGPFTAASIAKVSGIDRAHVATAIRGLARARVLIEDDATKGTRQKFYRITTRLIWRGGAYGYHAARAARPPVAIKVAP